MKIGRKEGVIESNSFDRLVISTSAGAEDTQGYRPLTRGEIIKVFTLLREETLLIKQVLHYILLYLGCKLNVAMQLRIQGIKQEDTGIWYIN